MIRLYGIPNCNTVKKARNYLEENNIEYEFHDFKKQGTDASKLQDWCEKFGWEKVINRAGMTWRKLDEAQKEKITNNREAIKLAEEKSSIIKRPITEINGEAKALGFKEEEYALLFG